jgi:YHS domain-containing protein
MVRRNLLFLFAVLSLVALVGPAWSEELTRVEAKRVCMVNDTVFPRDQIPVEVDGRTYFGCCEMCKGRLAKDTGVRQSVDPVSGKPVDKATAVIGAAADGKVRYFENDQTFAAYLARP